MYLSGTAKNEFEQEMITLNIKYGHGHASDHLGQNRLGQMAQRQFEIRCVI